MRGTVLRAQSGFFWVQTEIGVLECRLRGKLKRDRQLTDLAVIGDEVEVEQISPREGVVEAVHPRRSKLSRRAAGSRGLGKEDVIIANLDQVLVVCACADPPFHPRMLDRYLVICEYSELEAVIVASKVDLIGQEAAEALMAPYVTAGYTVLYTSTNTGVGLDTARARLAGRISVVTGKSGVGKSTLLNAIQPGLQLATGAVSDSLHKGRHTTTVAQLIALGEGQSGYVADTPGIREIGLWAIPQSELAWCFPELRPYLDDCYFSGCTHTHEPDCAVRTAVEAGQINPARYDSYTRLLAGDA